MSQRSKLHGLPLMDLALYTEGDPHALWRRLREEDPVHWFELPSPPGAPAMPGLWVLTAHADVVAVSRDADTFISRRGGGPPSPRDMIGPPDARPAPQLRMLSMLDPPDHAVMRRLIARAFTPKTLARLAPLVEECVEDSLRLDAGRSLDFVRDVAGRMPIRVLSALIGIPKDSWDDLARWTSEINAPADPEYTRPGTTPPQTEAMAFNDMLGLLLGVIERRQTEPADDLVSDLLAIQEDGKLTPAEVSGFCHLLLQAGHETVQNAISGGALALIESPAERARLAGDPSLLDPAVEEVARWTSPIMQFCRYVSRDTHIRETAIAAGERVMLVYPSANRDELAFPRADHFDVGRAPNEHVAFGVGHHFCLGVALARLQIRAMLLVWGERLGRAEITGPVRRFGSTFNNGVKSLPITLH